MCRHPFQENKRCIVVPTEVVPLLHTVWDGPSSYVAQEMNLDEMRDNTLKNIANIREDIKRPMNPTPYKVPPHPCEQLLAGWLAPWLACLLRVLCSNGSFWLARPTGICIAGAVQLPPRALAPKHARA